MTSIDLVTIFICMDSCYRCNNVGMYVGILKGFRNMKTYKYIKCNRNWNIGIKFENYHLVNNPRNMPKYIILSYYNIFKIVHFFLQI